MLQRGNPVETLAVQKAAGVNAGRWEFPGGKQEALETLPECLQRELGEELGIEATIGPWVGTSEFIAGSGIIRLHAYLVYEWSGQITLNEHNALQWLRVGQLTDLAWAPADIPLVQNVIQRLADSASR